MSTRQWREIWGVTLVTSALLVFCFLSASAVVGNLLAQLPLSGNWFVPRHWGFLVLSLLFWAAAPHGKDRYAFPAPRVNPWLTYVVPVFIALAYGWWLRPGPSLVFGGTVSDKLWHLALIPIGEELIFRGWLFTILNRRYDGKMATATNPFPVAGWFSSLAFSLWHLQNLGAYSSGVVGFQLFYTLLAGLWLSLLRWRTGRVGHCILGHAAINFATSLPPFP